MLYEWIKTFIVIYHLKNKSKYKFKIKLSLEPSSSFKFSFNNFKTMKTINDITIKLSIFTRFPLITFLHEYGHIIDIMLTDEQTLLSFNGHHNYNKSEPYVQRYMLRRELRASKFAIRLSKICNQYNTLYVKHLYWAFGTYLKAYKINVDKADFDYKAIRTFGLKDVIRF